jgi:hypothetical protein
MIFIGNTSASGDSIALEITIRKGLEGQAVLVGVLILIGVYGLIISEVVHRTLAAALGGLVAGNHRFTTRYDGNGGSIISYRCL